MVHLALVTVLMTTSASPSSISIELLGLDLDLLTNMLLVVDDPLLNALDYLFSLELEMQIMHQNPLSMTDTIDEEVYR